MIDALRLDGVRVVAPILPGHDESLGATMPGSTWREWLGAVEAAFDSLAIEAEPEGRRVALLGFSTGATLALALAKTRAVDRVILLAPFLAIRFGHWLPLGPGVWLRPIARVLPNIPRRSAATRNRLVRRELAGSSRFRTFSLPATLSALELIAQVVPTVGSITAPTLILQGRRDSVVEPSRAVWLHREIGSSTKRLIWLPRSDHLLAWDHDQAEVIAAIIAFARGEDRESPSHT